MTRYLFKLEPGNRLTYQTADELRIQYGLERVSVTTEPGYFFASLDESRTYQVICDPRIRDIEAVP